MRTSKSSPLVTEVPITICPNPVFVIGAPRSGTTVLAMALAQHSHLWASDESFIMSALFGDRRLDEEYERWSKRPCGSWLQSEGVTRDEFLSFLGLGWNALFTSRSDCRRWIDHTPHHALMAATLARMFPGAYFLYILRDGRRVVNSMCNVSGTLTESERKQMQQGNFLPSWATDFRKACEVWQHHNRTAMDFCTANPDRCLLVHHENIEQDPQTAFVRILDFLDAPYEDGPANYTRCNRINSSYIPGGEDPSVAYVPPDPWHTWSLDQRRIFAEINGEDLVRYGFATADELHCDLLPNSV